jgi:hypothetical protein
MEGDEGDFRGLTFFNGVEDADIPVSAPAASTISADSAQVAQAAQAGISLAALQALQALTLEQIAEPMFTGKADDLDEALAIALAQEALAGGRIPEGPPADAPAGDPAGQGANGISSTGDAPGTTGDY